jgi:hypothetical protein
MAVANKGIQVTPGSGATVATHGVTGVSDVTQYQVNMLVNPNGHLLGTRPRYGLSIPSLDNNVAHNYLWEFFNAPSSGLTVEVQAIYCVPDMRINRTPTTLAQQTDFFRTTAVSSGGSFGTFEASNSTMTAAFFRYDTADPSLSSHISCKTEMTSITTGARLWTWYSHYSTAGTLSGAAGAGALLQSQNIIPAGYSIEGKGFTLRPGTGLACRSGPIASGGSMGWYVDFLTDP